VVVLEGANKEPAYTEDLKDKVETIETIRDEFGDQLTDDELLDVVEAILYGEGELPEPKTTDDETDQTTLNTTAEGEDEVIEEPDDCLSVEYVLDLLAEVVSSDPETWSADNDLTRADLERVFEILEPNDDERYDEEVRETLLANISPYWTLYIHSLILGTNKAPRVYGKKVLAHVENGEAIRRPYPKPEVNNQRNSQVLKTYSESQEEVSSRPESTTKESGAPDTTSARTRSRMITTGQSRRTSSKRRTQQVTRTTSGCVVSTGSIATLPASRRSYHSSS